MWLLKALVVSYFFTEGLMAATRSPNPSIIIVGSGPSGIAAATKLLKNNFTEIKIFEAENRIGGRINSVKFGDAYVDLGAEFCHGEKDNIVYSMAKDFLQHSIDDTRYFRSNGEKIDEKTGNTLLNFAHSLFATNEPLNACENAASVGECLDIKMEDFPNNGTDDREKEIFGDISEWVSSYLCSYDSPLDLHDLIIITEYKTCEGDLHMHWNGLGYKTILEIMMQKFPNKENQLPIDNKIFLDKPVRNITNWQNEGKATVTTVDGTMYEADHVIFTPSIGVLKANYEDLFDPGLPEEKIDAIKNTGFGAILKVILHFPDKLWEEEPIWGSIFIFTNEDKEKLKQENMEWLLDLTAFAKSENNPKVIVSWFAGSHVPLIESLPEEKIMEAHKYLINKFLAPHYNVTMPDKLLRTTWYTNPNFRGTYSYESVEGHSKGKGNFQQKLGQPLINKDGKPTVLFAGEATHPYYFSTVHGAIESGYREADRLIKLYSNKQ